MDAGIHIIALNKGVRMLADKGVVHQVSYTEGAFVVLLENRVLKELQGRHGSVFDPLFGYMCNALVVYLTGQMRWLSPLRGGRLSPSQPGAGR